MKYADTIVVGLGAMGAATVYQLTRRGVDVVGIDQFNPPHDFGSSHGDTRITRQGVAEGQGYVPLARRSHEIWRELEAATGERILQPVGALILQSASFDTGPDGAKDFAGRTEAAARAYGIEHRMLDTDGIRSEFPQFHLPDEHRGYYEPGAGFVRPEAAVRAQLRRAAELGAVLRTGERVTTISDSGTGVVVRTDTDTYRADRLIVTAGPWTPQLLPGLRSLLRPYRQVQYWFEITGDPAAFSPGRFPVFIWLFENGGENYGFPALDGRGGGVKVVTEQYESTLESADVVDRAVGAEETRRMFERFVHGLLPGLGPRAVKAKTCMYTVSPDSDFVIDQAPDMPNTTFVSACSGHGFKHSAAVGESMAQLVTTGRSDVDLSPFSLGRFPSRG